MSLIMKDGVAYGAAPTSSGFVIPGDSNGEIKIVPEGATPYNVKVKGWDTKSDTDEKVKQTNYTTSSYLGTDFTIPFSKDNTSTTTTDDLYKNTGIAVKVRADDTRIMAMDPGSTDATTLNFGEVASTHLDIGHRTSAASPYDYLRVLPKDIQLGGTNNSWDGTNSSLKAALKMLKISGTATGNPIEITDGANAHLVKCVTAITGYQEGSGTPSPDNIRPIVAYTEGKIEVNYGYGNVTTHTATFHTAIYRGSVDYVNGTVTTEWGMIASYAGETLQGEWISDRDEYAPNTTPTTGAQVAYALATPTTSSVTVTNLPIRSHSGYNHIESSTGDMEIKYVTEQSQDLVDLIEIMTRS